MEKTSLQTLPALHLVRPADATHGVEHAPEQPMLVPFGVEIEMSHIAMARMHACASAALGVAPSRPPTRYGAQHDVRDAQGRIWEIKQECRGVHELATPVLRTREDLAHLCAVAQALSSAGACTLGACGLHIHVDAASFLPRDIVNLVALMARYQQPLHAALQVRDARRGYCMGRGTDGVQALAQLRHLGREAFCMQSLTYAGGRDRDLNITNLKETRKHTLEFRMFNATLDAATIERHVALVMGMVAAACGEIDFVAALSCDKAPTLAQLGVHVGLGLDGYY